MSDSVMLPKMRVTRVVSVGFLNIARQSWYMLFLPHLVSVVLFGMGGGNIVVGEGGEDVRGYPSSTGDQGDVIMLVRLPWVFGYWSLEI